MKQFLCLLTSVFVVVFSHDGHAYETSTHQILSEQAALQSKIYGDASLFSDMGLGSVATSNFIGTDGITRDAKSVIAYGSFSEDYAEIPTFSQPFGWIRPFNHFFDPQYSNGVGRGLDAYTGTIRGQSSPDWALEDRGDVTTLAAAGVASDRDQVYSYKAAQNHFYAALTSQNASTRQQEFSVMLQSLGQVIHHIQDMAQPQHTRNDTHKDSPANLYEKYTQKWVDSRLISISQANPYPIPVFGTARQYWLTPGATNTSPQYVGMAEFTARNYVSAGANFSSTVNSSGQEKILANPSFPLPSGVNADGTEKVIQSVPVEVRNLDGSIYSGPMYAVKGDVFDGFTNIHHTGKLLATTSLLDKSLFVAGKTRVFSTHGAIYEDNYPILLPRAVAFSAGLINHFFAGRVNVRRNTPSTGWIIENVTGESMNGVFSLYSEDALGNRQPIAAATWNGVLASGGGTPILGDAPTNSVKVVGVFNGYVGSEVNLKRVAGKVVPYEQVAIPCGQMLSATGSSPGLDQVMNMGSTAGPVEVEFEAYSIPDALDIYVGSGTSTKLVSTNGLVSGYKTWNFTHDPASRGTNNVHVKVTGNSNTGTQWVVSVSCPNQAISDSQRIRKQITVWFRIDDNVSGLGCHSGYWNVFLNGANIGRVYFSGLFGGDGIVSALATVGSAQYYQFVQVITSTGTTSGSCTGTRSYSYKDQAGWHALSATSGAVSLQ